jgi:hypothetical protein
MWLHSAREIPTLSEIPAHLLAGATVVASDDKIAELRKACQEWYDIQLEIETTEAALKDLRARSQEIQHKELPAKFAELNTDKIGLPDANVDIVVEPYYKASISSEWDQSRQNDAYSWLEENGHGGLMKVVVSVAFQKGELEKARELQELIRKSPIGNTHPVDVGMSVHWGTLTSFVKEQVTAGEVLPLDTLGAVVGSIAKVKKRKQK